MDTVTLVRSAIRGLLLVCERELEAELRALLRRDDDYRERGQAGVRLRRSGGPRGADRRAGQGCPRAAGGARRARACGRGRRRRARCWRRSWARIWTRAEDGVFRIARRVAKDRIISTVDPDARHGHKTAARGFDGYKGHVSVDPDSELIVATAVTPVTRAMPAPAAELLADDLAARDEQPDPEQADPEQPQGEQPGSAAGRAAAGEGSITRRRRGREHAVASAADGASRRQLSVYGDAAYGSGELLDTLEQADAQVNCKVQPPERARRPVLQGRVSDRSRGRHGRLPGRTHRGAWLRRGAGGSRSFGPACAGCPLAERCTTAARWAHRSTSAPTSSSSPAPARGRQTRPGRPTTPPPARRSSARSRT